MGNVSAPYQQKKRSLVLLPMRDREDGGKKVLSKTAMICTTNKLSSVGRHSRNFFGKSFKHQNQQFSYHRSNQQKQSQHKVVKNKDEVDFRDIMSENIVQIIEVKQSQKTFIVNQDREISDFENSRRHAEKSLLVAQKFINDRQLITVPNTKESKVLVVSNPKRFLLNSPMEALIMNL